MRHKLLGVQISFILVVSAVKKFKMLWKPATISQMIDSDLAIHLLLEQKVWDREKWVILVAVWRACS